MHSETLSNTLKKVLVLFGDKIVITFLHAFDHSCCLNRIITFSFLFFLVGCFCLLLLSWLALEKKKGVPQCVTEFLIEQVLQHMMLNILQVGPRLMYSLSWEYHATSMAGCFPFVST